MNAKLALGRACVMIDRPSGIRSGDALHPTNVYEKRNEFVDFLRECAGGLVFGIVHIESLGVLYFQHCGAGA